MFVVQNAYIFRNTHTALGFQAQTCNINLSYLKYEQYIFTLRAISVLKHTPWTTDTPILPSSLTQHTLPRHQPRQDQIRVALLWGCRETTNVSQSLVRSCLLTQLWNTSLGLATPRRLPELNCHRQDEELWAALPWQDRGGGNNNEIWICSNSNPVTHHGEILYFKNFTTMYTLHMWEINFIYLILERYLHYSRFQV